MAIIPNIEFSKSKREPIIDSETSLYELPFFKDERFFMVLDNLISYIKSIENLVRKSRYYVA